MKCNKCGETDLSKFSPSRLKRGSGYCNHCASNCTKQWRENNLEKWCAYHRNYQRKWMAEHPGVNNKNCKKWYDNHSDKHYEWRLKYVQEDPQRHRAQTYANKKIKDRQVCSIEGCFELGERHHEDYSKPYEITWLCRKHHKELHKKVKEIALVV